jgi:hypothetical protein
MGVSSRQGTRGDDTSPTAARDSDRGAAMPGKQSLVYQTSGIVRSDTGSFAGDASPTASDGHDRGAAAPGKQSLVHQNFGIVRSDADSFSGDTSSDREQLAPGARDASPKASDTRAGEPPAPSAAGLGTGDQAASSPPAPLAPASGQAPSDLPYRAEMEQSFGRPLGHVEAYTGMDHELAPYGAQALATGNVVAFADASPSPALVAHEVTHAVQNARAGASAPMASGIVAPRDSPAEAEADAVAGRVAAHGPGVWLPPITAAPAAHIQLAPKRLVPDPDRTPHPTIVVPDADHPARSDVDGEQVVQTGATTAPGKPTTLRGKSWKSLAEVAESVDVQDDSGDTLHVNLTYRLESRPAEVGEVPVLWIHTERKALLTIGTGEHAGATIVGQARIHLAPGEPRDPKAAIGKPSIGADHWAQIYLAEAGQYVNLHGPGGRASLRADAADQDVLVYDDPLRTLVGLKNLLKQQHVAGHGGDVAQAHARAQRLLASAKLGRAVLEREIASIKSHHDPHPGRVAPVRFLVGDIDLWLAANQQAGRDQTEDARQLHQARAELEHLLADAETTHTPRRNEIDDALHAPVRFAERTAGGLKEVGAMAVDAVALGVDAIGEATGVGTFDYHPISKYGQSIEATGSGPTTALVTMVNGFADEWSDAIERAKHGDYRAVTDVSIDTLLLTDGARTGGMIALDKAEAVAAKLGNVARSARAIMQSAHASAGAASAEVRNLAAAMANGADAFVARLRAGGMQMATAGGGGGGPGPNLGGLSADTLAEAAQAAKEAYKDTRLAQEAARHSPAHPDAATSSPPSGTPAAAGGATPTTTPTGGGGRYTESDIDAQINGAHGHVADMNIADRAWRDAGGNIIKVRAGRREVPVSARKVAQLEPDATHQTPGRQIVRVEVLATDGGGVSVPIGEAQSRPSPPHGARYDVPVSPPTWLRLHLADGSYIDWLSGATPPPGFRFQITPNSTFRNFGFSGGHTRDAWTQTMHLYADQIRELPPDHLAFTLPGRSTPVDVTIQPYEVRGVPDATGSAQWTRVRYPKSIFEGAGIRALSDFETYMAKYVTAAFNARPTTEVIDVMVPVHSLGGDVVDLRIRVTRKFDVPGGRITSWWVSENGIDPRLRPTAQTTQPTAGGPT